MDIQKEKRKVCILLSTYNGEKYLREQLYSICHQKGVDLYVLVRDDGSNDSTIEILEQYATKYSIIRIVRGENRGPAYSFYELMRYADKDYSDCDYFAFADQDDLWYDDKIYQAVTCLDASNNPYRFYYSNFDLIDADDIKFGEGQTNSDATYKTVIFRNHCIGCSQVFSRGLLQRGVDIFKYINSVNFDSRYLMLHDCWMSKLAYFLEAYIVGDCKRTFGYRQHGNNVTKYTGVSKFTKFRRYYKDYLTNRPSPFSVEASYLLEIERDRLSEGKSAFLNDVISYKSSWANTLSFAFSYSWLFKKRLSICIYAFILIITRRF